MAGPEHTCDLMVIGAGMAGMAASLFASDRGMAVVQAGAVGGMDFTTGLLDVLGVHPLDRAERCDDPWAGLARLVRDEPEHPYALVGEEAVRASLERFTGFLAQAGIPYRCHPDRNARVLTCAGTFKSTWLVPDSMWQGVLAAEAKAPCLVVDFHGLKGFSAAQVASVQARDWPGLRPARIRFPGFSAEIFPEHLAQALDDRAVCDLLADALAPLLDGEKYVGLPASLGLYGASDALARLQQRLGAGIFEIPTLPPSITGLRLRAAFEKLLPRQNVRILSQKLVQSVEPRNDGFLFHVGGQGVEAVVRAKAAVLASGRFFGKGLAADRTGVREAVFGLPVVQPAGREAWHGRSFFEPSGHPVNRAGVATDERLRPLAADGRPAFANLYAAGSILAHQDWMRSKCGAGLAISTAWTAVARAAEG